MKWCKETFTKTCANRYSTTTDDFTKSWELVQRSQEIYALLKNCMPAAHIDAVWGNMKAKFKVNINSNRSYSLNDLVSCILDLTIPTIPSAITKSYANLYKPMRKVYQRMSMADSLWATYRATIDSHSEWQSK